MASTISRFAFGADDVGGGQTANAAFANGDINFVHGSGRAHAIVTHVHPDTGDLNQTVVWYRYNGAIMTARRTFDGETWGAWSYAVGRTGSPSDNHNFLSIGVDGNGILWFAGNMHASALRTWRGLDPDDIEIASFTDPVTVTSSPFEGFVTYPAYTMLPSGDLRFSFRHGGSGSGGMVMYHYDHSDDEWSSTHGLTNVWIGEWTGSGIGYPNNAYCSKIVKDSNDNLHVAWLIRETVQGQTAHDLHYAKCLAADSYSTWRTVDGTPLTLPIETTGTGLPTLVAEIPQMSGLLRAPTLAVTEDGVPIVCAYHGDPFVQLYVWSHDGDDWFTEQVYVETGDVSWIGDNPTLIGQRWRLGTPHPVHRAGTTHVLTRQESLGNVITCYSNFDGTLSNWESSTIYASDTGEMDPCHIDDELRRLTGDSGRIHLLQGYCLAQGGLGTGLASSRSASVIEFDLPGAQESEEELGTISVYLRNALMDHATGVAEYPQPATIYAAAFVDSVEVAEGLGAYERLAVDNDNVTWSAASGRAKTNAIELQFIVAAGDNWGVVDEIRFFDGPDPENSNQLCADVIVVPENILDGRQLLIPAGAIDITALTGSGSDDLTEALLDHAFGGAEYTPETNVEIAYFAGDPQGAGVEITGTGYVRPTPDNDGVTWAAASNGLTRNKIPFSLGTAGAADWDEADNVAIFDAAGTGLMWSGELPEPRQVANGATEVIQASRLRPSLA